MCCVKDPNQKKIIEIINNQKDLVEGGRNRQAGCWPLRNVAGFSTALRAKRWALITLERRCRDNKSPTFVAFKQILFP